MQLNSISTQNSETVLVSIIVPVYNIETYIAQCIASIKSQTLSNYEALLVDDGSEDNSIKIAKRVIGNDKRFKIIAHEQNRGLPAARNTGLRAARGRYVWHVDGDDFLAEWALEKMVARAETDAADVVLGAGRIFPGGQPVRRLPRKLEGPISFADEPALWSGGGVVLFLFRRIFVQSLGNYFPEDICIGEDKVYLYNTLPHANVISFIHDPCYYYRVGVGMTADRIGSLEYLRDVASYIEQIRRGLSHHDKAWNYNTISQCEYRADLFVLATEIKANLARKEFFRRIALAYEGFRADLISAASSQPWRPVITVPAYLHRLYFALADGDGDAAEAEARDLKRCYLHPEVTLIKRAMYADRPEEALALAEALTQRHPSHAVAFHELARVRAKLGSYEAAEAAEQRALQLDSALVQSHLHLSKLLLRRSQTERAARHAKRAAEIEPDNCLGHVQLGNCFLRRGEINKASKCSEEALRIDPESADAVCFLSDVEMQKGNLDKALYTMENAVRINPADGDINDRHIRILSQRNTLLDALAAAKRWSYFVSQKQKPHIVMGDVLRKMERYGEAESAYRKALEIDPENASAHKKLSQSLLKLNRLDEALVEAKRAVECAPGNPKFLVFLGNALSQCNRISEAGHTYREALQLHSDFAPAKKALSKLAKQREGLLSKRRSRLAELFLRFTTDSQK
jgi:glycosyltransferase involved in cell wall biosynthesis/Flp pilus assembly protein TadD